MNKVVITAIMVGALALPGYLRAQSTPRVDKRQEKQESRIEKGVESGQLTKREARRLEKGQAHVQHVEDKALSDGKVTKAEKARIEAAQDKQSRQIYKQRHDKQKAKSE